MIYFFSYGDDNFRESKQRIYREAVESEFFDIVRVHGPEDISPEFKTNYADILKRKRGGGYWIWKFFFLDKYLSEINPGDFLIYADAGCTINPKGKKRFQEYLDSLEKSEYGFVSFSLHLFERNWTIRELYDYFGINPKDPKIDPFQYIATIFIVKKCPHSLMVLEEIMKLLKFNPLLITDDYNKQQKNNFFIDNRHDQSIFSLACKKYGSVVFHDETYLGPLAKVMIGYHEIKLIVKFFRENPRSYLQQVKVLVFGMGRCFRAWGLLININYFHKRYPFWGTRIRK